LTPLAIVWLIRSIRSHPQIKGLWSVEKSPDSTVHGTIVVVVVVVVRNHQHVVLLLHLELETTLIKTTTRLAIMTLSMYGIWTYISWCRLIFLIKSLMKWVHENDWLEEFSCHWWKRF